MNETALSRRLYYDDPYLIEFDARVVECLEWEGRPAVVLDHTSFYPTGGGQPHDVGFLDDVAVVDVVERQSDGAVIHVLAGLLDADAVHGQVDGEHRFDLMQQHTGQHILSAVFVDLLDANTVGFHLSDEYATIDVDCAPLTQAQIDEVEQVANWIVFDNYLVEARFVTDEEVARLPLRKPLAHEGPVRIVEIKDVDFSACGGTHVLETGEIGLIKIVRTERRNTETRIEFLCGGRALSDYRAKNALLLDVAREYTVGFWELGDLLKRMAGELKETRRDLRDLRDKLLDAEATALWHEAERAGVVCLVRAWLSGRTPDDLKHLAQRLVERHRTVALLGAGEAGEKGFFTFARSADVDLHMGNLVRQACQVIGGGGGGRPEFAQGGGPEGARVAEALDEVYRSTVGALAG
ncbi:MAG: alanyl-tRNA editing protein [Anaerolineae bacterium]|nr:alanyl-tRNA editing protein [Anaerolineae bacterium]